MSVFAFDWREYADRYREHGWVHIKRGASSVFVEEARRRIREDAAQIDGRGLRGEKRQHLFDFPADVDLGRDLFDVLAPLCGLDRATTTLSERHVKAYDEDADPRPVAHKDRFSSKVSVGISVEVPPGSHLVLYPFDDVGENPFLDTWLYDSLEPPQRPEVVLRKAREIEIHDEPGDVIVFRGSAFWHLRRESANAVNIYLKFNDFDCDPLGEDPSTSARRSSTLELLASDHRELLSAVPVLARRFDSVTRSYRREGWDPVLLATVWGLNPVPISDDEFALLRRLDGMSTIGSLSDGLADGVFAAVTRLAERGVIDLLAKRADGRPARDTASAVGSTREGSR
jgi:hypothetical protein